MWQLYAAIGASKSIQSFEEWRAAKETLRCTLLPKCGTRVRQTMEFLISDATPDRLWACAAEGYLFKIRRIEKHDPVPGDDMATDPDPDHGSREHAALGASSCYRWWNCPGSLNLAEHLRATTGLVEVTSSYAQEGTDAHTLAHICLLKGQDAIEYIDRVVNERVVDDEMASAVQVYLDVCHGLMKQPGIECLTEKRFNLKALNPPGPMFGTADFVAIDKANKKITIVDLKYGKGINVEAEDNPQLKYYALGVICALFNIPITTIEAIIVQPRGTGRPVKRTSYKASELFDWSTELMKRAAATRDPNAPRAAGSWCRFCPAAGSCPTQAEAAYSAAQIEFTADPGPGVEIIPPSNLPAKLPELRLLTPQQLGDMKRQFPILKQFMEAVDDALRAYVAQGFEGTGWKLAAGEGNRQWMNEDQAARDLVSKHGLGPSETHDIVMISPAEAERRLVAKLREAGFKAKDAQALVKAELAKMTVRPATAPRLVEESHPNPGLPAPGSEFVLEPAPTTT
mgnify:CR=1 FL=1